MNTAKDASLHPPEHAARQETDVWGEPIVEETIVPLSHTQATRLFGEQAMRPSQVTPFRVVRWQVVVSLLASLAWSVWGKSDAAHSSAISALLGGLLCVIPSAVFAARLRMNAGQLAVSALVIGELLKVMLTLALFVLVAVTYPAVQWGPLLLTFVLALKMYWLALWVK